MEAIKNTDGLCCFAKIEPNSFPFPVQPNMLKTGKKPSGFHDNTLIYVVTVSGIRSLVPPSSLLATWHWGSLLTFPNLISFSNSVVWTHPYSFLGFFFFLLPFLPVELDFTSYFRIFEVQCVIWFLCYGAPYQSASLPPYVFTRPLTHTHVRLFGPCFHTGQMEMSLDRMVPGAHRCRPIINGFLASDCEIRFQSYSRCTKANSNTWVIKTNLMQQWHRVIHTHSSIVNFQLGWWTPLLTIWSDSFW